MEVKIETKRLLIHSYSENDFENCVSLYGNEALTRYFEDGKPRTREQVRVLIEERGNKYFIKNEPFGLFSIFNKKDHAFMGQIDFTPVDDAGSVELGFILHQEYHNQGFCTEAVKAFIFDYVPQLNTCRSFKSHPPPITRIIATVHIENQPSRKILQKVGMTLEKTQERFGSPRFWYALQLS